MLIESGQDRILIDAGFSGRETEKRLRLLGVSAESIGAVILTHEHQDHCRGAQKLSRKYDFPIYGSRGTLEGCRFEAPKALRLVPIVVDTPLRIAGMQIVAFPVPHDAREPLGFVVTDEAGRSAGVVSDLGEMTASVARRLTGLDILVHESNHDESMLLHGPYPWELKRRVAGNLGHLSNEQAAESIAALACDELRWVALVHLSRTNNRPRIAAADVGERLDRVGSKAEVVVTSQREPSPWLEV